MSWVAKFREFHLWWKDGSIEKLRQPRNGRRKKFHSCKQFKAMCGKMQCNCATALTLGKSRPWFLFPLMSFLNDKFFALTSLSNRLLAQSTLISSLNFRRHFRELQNIHFGFFACDRVQVFHFSLHNFRVLDDFFHKFSTFRSQTHLFLWLWSTQTQFHVFNYTI